MAKYREAFLSLTMQVIKEMQFRVNAKTLEELDNETIDDDVSVPKVPKVAERSNTFFCLFCRKKPNGNITLEPALKQS